MLVTDGTVSASDGAFDVPEGSVDPLERGRQGGLAASSCDNRLFARHHSNPQKQPHVPDLYSNFHG
jgi:hypothetical protein